MTTDHQNLKESSNLIDDEVQVTGLATNGSQLATD